MPLLVTEALSVTATPDRVWRAITDPAELFQWYAPGCQWEIPLLAVGASVRFFNSATDIQPATIVEFVPARRLALRWRPDPSLPMATLCTTYALTPTDTGTTIVLEHGEYESVPEPQRAEWLAADRGAVPAILEALGRHVSVG